MTRPIGRPIGSLSKDKPLRDALRMEAAKRQNDALDFRGLRKVASKLFDKAEEGDIQAIREIGDRRDGRVLQSIGGSDELPAIGVIVTGVVRAGDEDRSAVLTYQDSNKLSDDSGD